MPDISFSNRSDTCYKRAILFFFPSSVSFLFFLIRNLLAAGACRENQFFPSTIFFTLSSAKFPRQTDNTDGSFRQKPRTSKSEKRWSFPFTEGHFEFFFVYFLHLQGVSFSLMLSLLHTLSFFHSLSFSLFLPNQRVSTCLESPENSFLQQTYLGLIWKIFCSLIQWRDQMRIFILTRLKGNTRR